jgi:hypothetical protein
VSWALTFEVHIPFKWGDILLSCVICHDNTQRIVHCRELYMPLTPGICNSWAVITAREYTLHYSARRCNGFLWQQLQHLRHTWMRTPASEGGILAVEELRRYRTRTGTVPTVGTSKFFVKMNCICATTHGWHICLLRMQICQKLRINTLHISSFYTVLCGQMKGVSDARMSTAVPSGYYILFGVRIWDWIIVSIFFSSCLLSDGDWSAIWSFSGNCFTRAAWRCSFSCEALHDW